MYLLFDIGGTKIRLTVSNGQIIPEPEILDTPQDYKSGVDLIKQRALKLCKGEKIEAVAGGIASILDKEKSVLLNSPHMSGWTGKPFKRDLEEALEATVYMDNDSAIVGLGEAVRGAGQGYSIVAYITISTGVGGVRVVNGVIDQSCLGFEPGHQVIVANGDICPGCGGLGHLESYVSGSSLEKRYGKKAEEITDAAVWDELAKKLAVGLNNIMVMWSPEVIVLGGSLTKSLPLDKVVTNLAEMKIIFINKPEIKKAVLGDTGGLYGALEYLNQHSPKVTKQGFNALHFFKKFLS